MSSIPTPSSLRTPRASAVATPRRSLGVSASRPGSRTTAQDAIERDKEFEELMAKNGTPSERPGMLGRSVSRKTSQLGADEEGTPNGLSPRTSSALSRSTVGKSTTRPAVVNGSSGLGRTPSLRQSVVHSKAAAARTAAAPVPGATAKVGDRVAGAAMQGLLKFLGAIEGKAGSWAGIDLSGTEWEGRGKNDGTVGGKPYFECPPLCGIFVPAGKITVLGLANPFAASPSPSPSPSPTATRSQVPTPASPSIRTSPLLARSMSRPTVPSNSLSASVMAGRSAPKSSSEARQLATSKITEGSRASKYLGVTAAQLAARRAALPVRSASPTKGTDSPRDGARSPSRPSGGLPVPKTPSATPRAGARPRQSLGPALTGRKSLGPGAAMPPPLPPPPQTPTATPSMRRSTMGPSAVAATRRVAASDRDRSTPDVPPLPSEYRSSSSLSMSVSGSRPESRLTRDRESGASSVMGDRTPATRRRSRASMGPDVTPSARPASALSMSTSGRSSVLSVDRFVSEERAERDRELRDAKSRAEEFERKLRDVEEVRKVVDAEKANAKAKVVDLEEKIDGMEKELREVRDDLARKGAAEEARFIGEQAFEELKATHAAQLVELTSEHEARLTTVESAHAAERADLMAQLDELRAAGQALCEVYEEKIANQVQARVEAEDHVHRVETELSVLREERVKGAEGGEEGGVRVGMSEADLIDNEVLRADLKHARDRLSEIQEQLDEAREALATETASSASRAQERGETQQRLKDEVRRLKDEVGTKEREKEEVRRRVGEVEAELREARRSQENERAELEQLRADAVVVQEVAVLRSRLDDALEQAKVAEEEVVAAKGREKALQEELDLVGEIKTAEEEQEVEEVKRLKRELEAREEEIRSLRRGSATHTAPTNIDSGSHGATTPRKSLSPGSAGVRESALSSSIGSRRTSGSGFGPANGDAEAVAAMKEQIVGLKSIIARMTEERAELQQGQRRTQAEADELRETNKSLEASLDKLANGDAPDAATAATARTKSGASSMWLEGEVEELKARLFEMERKHGREVKALNKEVSELESLVEAKIFREDELESEIAHYKALLRAAKEPKVNGHDKTTDSSQDRSRRHKSSSSSNGTFPSSQLNGRPDKKSFSPRKSSGTLAGLGLDDPTPHSPSTTTSHRSSIIDEDACELCGQGHQLDQCPIFLGTANLDGVSAPAFRCSNCESDDHTTEDCPHGDEVF